MKRLLGLALAVVLVGPRATADGIPPVTVEVRETEPGRYLVRWRVPAQLPPSAHPVPVLPATFLPTGEGTAVERPGAWFRQQAYRSPAGLSGELVGVHYPFLNVTITTLLRVELLSGERHAHLLAPGEDTWRVPESAVGRAPPVYSLARDAVLEGALHFAGNPVHLVFLLALVLLGAFGSAVRLATAFTAGQLGAAWVHALSGLALGPAYAEIGVAVGAALLAREALRPVAERRQLAWLAAAAGGAHGLGLGAEGFLQGALVVLGLDAALLVSLALVSLVAWAAARVVEQERWRTACSSVAAYVVAGGALALACVAPVRTSQAAAVEPSRGLRLPELSLPNASASSASSRRVATRVPEAALQSFLAIEAFEVRHEVLVRLGEVAEQLELDPSGVLAVEDQWAAAGRLQELVTSRNLVTIDGTAATPVGHRVDFLTLSAQGALPRPSPVPEPIAAAWVGVTAVYVTEATPRDVALTWEPFDLAPAIPATLTDPESAASTELTAGRRTLAWSNELVEDPAPVVRATAVEPAHVWVPLGALVALGAALCLAAAALRVRRRAPSLALARVLLAGAFLLAPVAETAWSLPRSSSAVPDRGQARQILASVLPNVYRAFEFPTEASAYDRLALTVAGPTLREVYLEHRRAVEMEERGGARARVEAVEVVDVDAPQPGGADAPGGFVVRASWTVGGTVTHFGHRHFRQNGYDARVTVVPVEGAWKIRSIEVLDEERLR